MWEMRILHLSSSLQLNNIQIKHIFMDEFVIVSDRTWQRRDWFILTSSNRRKFRCIVQCISRSISNEWSYMDRATKQFYEHVASLVSTNSYWYFKWTEEKITCNFCPAICYLIIVQKTLFIFEIKIEFSFIENIILEHTSMIM